MRHLLDVNVVLAIIDPAHEHHEAAFSWFGRVGRAEFATCPIVENGVLRIASSAAYPNRPGDVDVVSQVLSGLCSLPGHEFWSDTISLRTVLPAASRVTSRQVTDIYLVALAAHHRGRFATFDRHIPVGAVANAGKTVVVLDT